MLSNYIRASGERWEGVKFFCQADKEQGEEAASGLKEEALILLPAGCS